VIYRSLIPCKKYFDTFEIMGSQTIIHGRITLKGDVGASQKYVSQLRDDNYPKICREMFSIGATEYYAYYEEPVIAFAATYKSVEDDWDCFILKFEHLLRNIEFDTAKLQMETEYLGDYHFFWKSKTEHTRFEEKDKFIEMPEWFFGYGYRCVWGLLEEEQDGIPSFPFEFDYPVRPDEEILAELLQMLQAMEQGNLPKQVFVNDYLSRESQQSPKLYLSLTALCLREGITFGYETHKGHWIRSREAMA
jgi:hypothetical protein